MEVILKYRATDGTEWTTADDACRRDHLDAEVRALEARLGPRVQHGRRPVDILAVAAVKAEVVNLCRLAFPTEPVFRYSPQEIDPFSYAGRLLSEVRGPLNRIWCRFSCMNGDWEYEQPFFALHPEEYDQQFGGRT